MLIKVYTIYKISYLDIYVMHDMIKYLCGKYMCVWISNVFLVKKRSDGIHTDD